MTGGESGNRKNGKTDAVTVACIGLLPLVATLMEKGAVVVLMVLGAIGIAGALRAGQLARLIPRAGLIFLALALLWFTYRSIDTFDGVLTVDKLLKTVALVIFGFGAAWLVRTRDAALKARALDALGLGAAISLVVITGAWLLVATGNQQIINTNRSDILSLFSSGMVTITILSPAIVARLLNRQRLGLAMAFVVAVLTISVLSSSNAATVTMFALMLVAAVMWRFPNTARALVFAGCVAGTLLLPAVISTAVNVFGDDSRPSLEGTRESDPDGFAGSLGHRYYIWKFATEKAAERPFQGWGFNASKHIPGGHETIAIGKELMPLHPHNATLQFWLELGIPGLVLGAGFFWLMLRMRIGRALPPAGFAVLPLTLLGIFVSWNTTYGIWQSWWFSILALVVATLFLWETDAEREAG